MLVAIRTENTKVFKIANPVLLPGMNVIVRPKLAVEVTNVGGIEVISGLQYGVKMLKEQISELKCYLNDKNVLFELDLLLLQVGSKARYTPPPSSSTNIRVAGH